MQYRILRWLFQYDFWLLRIAQCFVNFCGRKWGWDFIKLGQKFVLFGVVSYVLRYYWIINGTVLQLFSITFGAVVWMIFHGVITHIATKNAQKRINPNIILLFAVRVSGWITFPIIFFLSFWTPRLDFILPISTLSCLMGYYILSCQKPPPKEVKYRVPSNLAWNPT